MIKPRERKLDISAVLGDLWEAKYNITLALNRLETSLPSFDDAERGCAALDRDIAALIEHIEESLEG